MGPWTIIDTAKDGVYVIFKNAIPIYIVIPTSCGRLARGEEGEKGEKKGGEGRRI